MSSQLDAILARLDAMRPQSQARWFDLLRIPSVSAQPAHAADCQRAAEWWRDRAGRARLRGRACARPPAIPSSSRTSGARRQRAAPALLRPLRRAAAPSRSSCGTAPPFEPAIVEGPHGKRFVARGAVDDKGQTMMWLEALRAWHDATGGAARAHHRADRGRGGGRQHQPGAVPRASARPSCAPISALISDTGMWDIDTPAIDHAPARHGLHAGRPCRPANRDLHSGHVRRLGAEPDQRADAHPRRAAGRERPHPAARLLRPRARRSSPNRRAQWEALGFDEAAFLGGIGLTTPVGERGRSALERLWARPTADINGIWGGYTGRRQQDGDRRGGLGQGLLPPGARPGPGRGGGAVQAASSPSACRPTPNSTIETFSARPAIEVPGDSHWVRTAHDGAGGGIRQPGRADRQRRLDPGGDTLRRDAGRGHAADGVRAGGRPGAQPEREVRACACFHHGIRCHVRLLAKLAA